MTDKMNLSVHIVSASQSSDGHLDYVEEVHFAAEQLKETNVFASDEAVKVLKDYEGSEIALVEVPKTALDEWGMTTQEVSQDLLDRTGSDYEMVITYVSDTDQFGLASTSKEITVEAYETILANEASTVEESLFQEYGELTATVDVNAGGDAPFRNAAAGVAVAGGGIIGAVVIVTAIAAAVKAAGADDEAPKSTKVYTAEADRVVINNSAGVNQFTIFRELAKKHRDLGYDESAKLMQETLSNLEELFNRIIRSGDQNKKNLAEVEYANILERLNRALGEEYYLDIKAKPKYWNHPKKRIIEVNSALQATDNLVIANIQQHNELRDLDFRVGLEGILHSEDAFDPTRLLRKSN